MVYLHCEEIKMKQFGHIEMQLKKNSYKRYIDTLVNKCITIDILKDGAEGVKEREGQ